LLSFGAESFVFQFLSKNIKIKVYKTIILPVLCGRDTWSVTLREERRPRVLENRVLWKIFGPKRDEVTWDWRKLRNEEFNDISSSPNNVRMIKSSRMRWAGHVARLGDGRGASGVWLGNLSEADRLEGIGIVVRIILKWIFRKWDVGAWTGLIRPRIETSGGHL